MQLTNTKMNKYVVLLKKTPKHFNVETVRNLCKKEIADFEGISYGDVTEIIHHISRTVVRIELQFSGDIVVDRVFRISS